MVQYHCKALRAPKTPRTTWCVGYPALFESSWGLLEVSSRPPRCWTRARDSLYSLWDSTGQDPLKRGRLKGYAERRERSTCVHERARSRLVSRRLVKCGKLPAY
jgi:hypothetical protein